ncbi:MAG: flagellar hook protein FlgE [Pseudomonadota bacterium]
MAIFGAMRAGVSGLNVQAQALATASDNISNSNTTGYKATRTRFRTLVTSPESTISFSPGGVQSVVRRETGTQGLLQTTSTVTDLGISGAGFFTVTDQLNRNAVTGRYDIDGNVFFTRAGSFRPDSNGNLINPQGFYLTGWPANDTFTGFTTSNIHSTYNGINVGTQTVTPVATTQINLNANVASTATFGGANSTFSITTEVFDRQGVQHSLQVDLIRTNVNNTWDVRVRVTDSGFTGGIVTGAAGARIIDNGSTTGATPVGVRVGTILFSANGTPQTFTPVANTSTLDAGAANNAGNLRFQLSYDATPAATPGITVDDVDVTLALGTIGLTDGITQFDGANVLNSFTQNGRQFGSLRSVSVNTAGIVTATYDNGSTSQIYQIPVTTFNNPSGATPSTGNVYQESSTSGQAVPHVAGTGGAGSVNSSALEASTVDLALEFTELILAQRNYSANTRSITTANQMLQELNTVIR